MATKQAEQNSKNMGPRVKQFLIDFFLVGMDRDGNRMFSINLQVNKNTPNRQRYDRYCGLMGQIEDCKNALTQVWRDYCQAAMQEEQEQQETFDNDDNDDDWETENGKQKTP